MVALTPTSLYTGPPVETEGGKLTSSMHFHGYVCSYVHNDIVYLLCDIFSKLLCRLFYLYEISRK